MKVIKEKKQYKAVTLRISEETMERIDEIAEKNKVSRQKLVEAILEQVMANKSFVVKVN